MYPITMFSKPFFVKVNVLTSEHLYIWQGVELAGEGAGLKDGREHER